MDGFLTFDNQITLIDSVIKTTNKLLPVLNENVVTNDTIHSTIKQIFTFLNKVLNLLPDLLISEDDNKHYREETIKAFNRVNADWESYKDHPEEFEKAWGEFTFWWDEFSKVLKEMKDSTATIYLSMN